MTIMHVITFRSVHTLESPLYIYYEGWREREKHNRETIPAGALIQIDSKRSLKSQQARIDDHDDGLSPFDRFSIEMPNVTFGSYFFFQDIYKTGVYGRRQKEQEE